MPSVCGQGPIPYLPDPDILVRRMEKTWGDLDRYRGIQSTAKGGAQLIRHTLLLGS